MIAAFAASPLLWACTVGLFGLLVGSFLNVVIHRLPRMMERDWQAQCAEMRGEAPATAAPFNLILPGSTCPTCGHGIRWWENIPLISYLLLHGRCSACRAPISPRYPMIEGLTGLLSLTAAWQFGFSWQTAAALVLIWVLIALTAIDLDTLYLPDDLTLPLLWLGLLVNISGLFIPLTDAVIGAMAGYLVLWLVYHLFRLLTGKEGMGYGDFKLLAALGAWFGWTQLPLIILCASLIGALIGIALISFAGHDRSKPIPFGPYLALAGLITLFWGDSLTRLYLGA